MPFWVRRAPKVFVRFLARCLHGPSHRESHKVESLWFIKVVSTLTCICGSKNLTLLSSDYFRQNLSPSISFFVIQHLCTNCRNPRLAFEFFQYTRLNLALIQSVSTFDLLLRLFCRMGLFDFVKLVSDYMSTGGFLVNAALLETLATSLVDAGKFSVAADILISQGRLCAEKNEVVGSFVYNKFLSLLVKRNRVSEAVRFFEDHILGLRGFCPDTCTFNIVIQGLCRTGQFDMALDCFNKMESFGCLPDIFSFNALINGLCTHGKVDRARELLRGIQSQGLVSPNVMTYTSTIYGFCKVGRMEDAGRLFSDMMAYGVRPNLHTFNVLIDGFCKSGDIPSSLKMFDSMNSFSLAPDVVTFTSLISGYCQNGELDTALKLWDEMHAKELLANAYTFSIVVTALCKVNRLNEARDLLKQILLRNDIVPQAFIYNPVIDGFCKSGNLDEAMTIVEEMEAKKCKPDKYTYTILIMGHCMKGRMHDAIDLFNKMSVVGCAPDQITIDSLVSCLLKAGMASEGYWIKKSAVVGVQARSSSSKTPDSQWENIGVPVIYVLQLTLEDSSHQWHFTLAFQAISAFVYVLKVVCFMCVLRGCVPEKLLVYASKLSHEFEESHGFGWSYETDPKHDWSTLIANKNAERQRLTGIYKNILKNASVKLIEGRGKVLDPHTVDVDGKICAAKNILISVFIPDIPGREYAIDSDAALGLPLKPKKIAIVGGGYVAVEFAGIINGLGSEVHVFIRQKKVLWGFDEEIRDFLCEQMALKGIELHAEESPQAITKQPDGLLAVLTNRETVDGSSHVMFATGRRPNTKNFGLEAVGIKMSKEGLSVRFQL